MSKYVRVMDGLKSNAGGFEYKIDEVNVTDNWNPNSLEAEEMGGFNFGTEDKKRTGIVFIIDMDGRNVNIVTSGSAILYLDDARNKYLDGKTSEYLIVGKNEANLTTRRIEQIIDKLI